MPVITNSKSVDYTPCPEGSFPAAIVRVYYVGTQVNTYNPTYKPIGKIILVFELDEPLAEGDGNYRLSKSLSLSLGEKGGLYKLFKPVLGSTFPAEGQQWSPESLLGLKVLATVAHTVKEGKTYANIESLGRIPRGMVPFEPQADEFCWSYDDPPRDGVPQWVVDLAAKCTELTGEVKVVNTARAPQPQDDLQTFQAKAAARGVNMEPVDPDETPF
jgi:hypothetical protein